jgi:minor extracellular serine protease Vpr
MSARLRVRPFGRSLIGLAALVAIAGLTLASAGSASIAVDTIEPLTPQASPDFTPRFEGTNLWFVELQSAPAVKGTSVDKLKAEKQAFRDEAAAAEVSYTERYAFDTLWNGLSIEVDPDELSTLNRLPGVKALYPVGVIEAPKEETVSPDLQTALAMTGADVAQSELGFNGTGIKVAVMDTGIDYDHPDLGGDGTTRENSHEFPNSRVVAGFDFVGDDYNASETSPAFSPKPHPDRFPDDCFGHGTHVAGIVGASGDFATGGARGVAPGVTFGSYRVFGCDGSTTDDVMIAAMERILADGMDVLNMSIGDAFNNWPDSPTAAASDNLVDNGVVVVASIGNSGADGVYSAGAPGVGNKVIGVASFDNTHIKLKTFTVTPDATPIGYQTMTGAANPPTSGSLPLAKTGTPTTADDGCAALAPGSMTGKAVLIRRGTCTFRIKAVNALNAGAAAVLIYNNAAGRFAGTVVGTDPAGDLSATPVVSISNTEGALLNDRIAAGPTTLTWTNQEGTFVNPTGGLISSFSSYGLTADLQLKPDIGAPGGLIRSTWPLEQGAYATISGTSMASPHVAGAVALLLQAKGWTSPTPAQAASIRGLLQNTAVPAVWAGNPGLGFLDQVHRQGAGLMKIDKAITAPVSISPGKLTQGEAGADLPHTLTLTNGSASAVTYDASHQAALSTFGSTFVPSATTTGASAGGAITITPSPVTVPAGGTATVTVTIPRPDFGAANKLLYGGYIRFIPQGGGTTLRVPYAGFGGDYQGIPVLTSGGATSCGTNEVQSVAITGTPTGGSFTLSFTPPAGGASQTTAPIAYNATAADVRTALAALAGIGGTANVNTGGGPLPGTAVSVTFQGTLGCRNIPQMTANGAALTGGTTPAAAVTTTTQGATSFPKLAKRVGFVSAGDFTPTYTFPETGTIVYTMSKPNVFGRKAPDIPTVGVHLDHQATWLKITVLDADGNPVVSSKEKETLDPVAFSAERLSRNQTAGGFFAFGWDGKLVFTKTKSGKEKTHKLPNGDYKLRVQILKALGTAPADVETYTSPTFTIARPHGP